VNFFLLTQEGSRSKNPIATRVLITAK